MPIAPAPPYPKSRSDAIRSQDWNQIVDEVIRLDNAKVNKLGDDITGPLTISGNVGVGTASPENADGWSKVLDVLGVGNAKLSVRTAAIDGRVMSHDGGFFGSPAGMVVGTASNHALSFATNSATRMTISGAGDVEVMGQLGFGAQTRQMINLWNANYGIGVQGSTQYFRSDADFGWYRGGVHDDGRQNPGGGVRLMAVNASGDLILSARTNPAADPAKPLCRALVDLGDKLVVNFGNDYANGVETPGSLSIGNALGFSAINAGDNEIGLTRAILGLFGDSTNVLKLSLARRQLIGEADPSYGLWMGHPNQFRVGNFTLNGFNAKFQLSSTGDVNIQGRLTAQDLTIRSGNKAGYVSDYFINAVGDALEQGDVVVVADAPVGHFHSTQNDIPIPEVDLAAKAYDTRVCGIVAKVATENDLPFAESPDPVQARLAAGTIQPEDLPAPEHPLKALAAPADAGPGKVADRQMGYMVTMGAFSYCKVDADIAPVAIGDLLTTSPTKGHAQKVLEPERALGAILGKALGALDKGKGTIPILVMLQ